jgi:predicted amidophosphoribosyltransferase
MELYRCKHCLKQFFSVQSLKEHGNQTGHVLICGMPLEHLKYCRRCRTEHHDYFGYCKRRFGNQEELNRHIVFNHKGLLSRI